MVWTALVTWASLVLFLALSVNVARARVRYKVVAPATQGDPAFERRFRVQQNTVESALVFLPALWLFAWFVADLWAAALGVVWIVGRVLYARGYYADAAKRGPGFGVAAAATISLLIGGAVAIVRGLLVLQSL